MKYKLVHQYEMREFNKDFAVDGDMYLYDNGKLVYVCNSIPDTTKPSLLKRIKRFFWHKKTGVSVTLDKRTLEYIYNVCKGVMPSSKREFIDCVLGSIPK